VADEERDRDLLHDAVVVHRRGKVDELRQLPVSSHPPDVLPVVRPVPALLK
jgi:hypothetical protein